MEKLTVIEKRGALQLVQRPTFATRIKQGAIIATGTALAIHTNAASSIDASGLTNEIEGGKEIITGLFAAGLILLGIFAGWRYIKRGANSA
ncbi:MULTISPECIES: major capsid protein [Acinetobacter]|uniref:major capsid protein n=1 Tax=Acinetobacter TaxID=469 RepID=UPI0002CF70CA|nr:MULTISPECIES: major capsid protein [Acinetobacter]ENW90914.1 hypothetical protein F905_00942 [Acinetobacter sp. CIP 53.82]MBA0156456.1 hypothetical protein [Acinetobacter indicus]